MQSAAVPPPAPYELGSVPDFRTGGSFTVGVEEELMLVDPAGELLGAAGTEVVDAVRHLSPEGVVTGEIYADQVELNSPVCHDAEAVVGSLARLRARVLSHGACAMAVGLHPTAPFGAVALSTTDRYAAIAEEYAGLLRTPTAALQVHVGLPDADAAMLAYRALRTQVPLLRALGAGTPFWHGIDSGLASSRSAVIRSYPRTTVPPLLRTWEEFVERTEQLVVSAEAPGPTYVWWDLRPRPELGTLEVRVMDSQPDLRRVAALTALVQGIARHGVAAPRTADLPDHVLAVNDERATRYGLDARVTDDDGRLRPLREVGRSALARARAELGTDGLARPLDEVEQMLTEPGEPHRQREVARRAGLTTLLTDLVDRTTAGLLG